MRYEREIEERCEQAGKLISEAISMASDHTATERALSRTWENVDAIRRRMRSRQEHY